MIVSVKYVAPGLLGKLTEINLEENSKISDLVACLVELISKPDLFFDPDGTLFPIFVVNGKRAFEDFKLSTKDHVVIIPPIGGG